MFLLMKLHPESRFSREVTVPNSCSNDIPESIFQPDVLKDTWIIFIPTQNDHNEQMNTCVSQ